MATYSHRFAQGVDAVDMYYAQPISSNSWQKTNSWDAFQGNWSTLERKGRFTFPATTTLNGSIPAASACFTNITIKCNITGGYWDGRNKYMFLAGANFTSGHPTPGDNVYIGKAITNNPQTKGEPETFTQWFSFDIDPNDASAQAAVRYAVTHGALYIFDEKGQDNNHSYSDNYMNITWLSHITFYYEAYTPFLGDLIVTEEKKSDALRDIKVEISKPNTGAYGFIKGSADVPDPGVSTFKIYYTDDGSTPNNSSPVWGNIDNTLVVSNATTGQVTWTKNSLEYYKNFGLKIEGLSNNKTYRFLAVYTFNDNAFTLTAKATLPALDFCTPLSMNYNSVAIGGISTVTSKYETAAENKFEVFYPTSFYGGAFAFPNYNTYTHETGTTADSIDYDIYYTNTGIKWIDGEHTIYHALVKSYKSNGSYFPAAATLKICDSSILDECQLLSINAAFRTATEQHGTTYANYGANTWHFGVCIINRNGTTPSYLRLGLGSGYSNAFEVLTYLTFIK